MFGVGGGEGLEVDVVVVASTGFGQLVLDVGDGGLVAGRAKDTVAFRGRIGEFLELAGALEEVVALDVVSQAFLWSKERKVSANCSLVDRVGRCGAEGAMKARGSWNLPILQGGACLGEQKLRGRCRAAQRPR